MERERAALQGTARTDHTAIAQPRVAVAIRLLTPDEDYPLGSDAMHVECQREKLNAPMAKGGR